MRSSRLRKVAAAIIVALIAPGVAVRAASELSTEEIARLVADLGADDYSKREAAAAKLERVGAAAVDSLLAAAEMSDDLEIALRARWLVDTIPLESPGDAPEAAKLLAAYRKGDLGERVRVMHRLLRVDDDGGVESLARIVRLDRSPLGSRVAAALLAREWQPADPYWDGMRGRVSAGLGASKRPAAEFLRALVAFSATADAGAREAALEGMEAACTELARAVPATDDDEAGVIGEPDGADATQGLGENTLRIFERCRIQSLVAAGRREQALAAVERLFAACFASGKGAETAAEEAAGTLIWFVERGLPEAVDRLAGHAESVRDDAVLSYAVAVAERTLGRAPQADATAEAAFAKPNGTNAEFVDRLQTALVLTKWGAGDWAAREFGKLLDDPRTPTPQFALASILFAEYLHDQEREDEAAACLRRLFEGRPGKGRVAGGAEGLLQTLGRDPQSIRSRMHYFEACGLLARGDTAAARRSLEEALRVQPKDVDALIGLYRMPDNTPAQKADAVARIKRATLQIEGEIEAVPADANGYNEYAWLVANTEGDLRKATRYSKLSLEKSFDSSSYLDTLAHCQAAAGDRALAVRTQSLALRQEPHNRTIRKNLERFRQP